MPPFETFKTIYTCWTIEDAIAVMSFREDFAYGIGFSVQIVTPGKSWHATDLSNIKYTVCKLAGACDWFQFAVLLSWIS